MSKLFIPGPIDVSKETFAAMSQPMIGHRGSEFEALYASTQPGAAGTRRHHPPVLPLHLLGLGRDGGRAATTSARKKSSPSAAARSPTNGSAWPKAGPATPTKSKSSGARRSRPEAVRAKLEEGGFDLVTLIHNETSTGVMNDLAGIAKVVKSFPGVLLVVDSVSSFSAVPIEMDALGIDVLLAGVQKALALPPGLAVFACSEAALERAKSHAQPRLLFRLHRVCQERGKEQHARPPRRSR